MVDQPPSIPLSNATEMPLPSPHAAQSFLFSASSSLHSCICAQLALKSVNKSIIGEKEHAMTALCEKV